MLHKKRRQRLLNSSNLDPQIPDNVPGFDRLMENAEREQKLRNSIARLPERCRRMVQCCFSSSLPDPIAKWRANWDWPEAPSASFADAVWGNCASCWSSRRTKVSSPTEHAWLEALAAIDDNVERERMAANSGDNLLDSSPLEWDDSSRRIWSLWEMMNRVDLSGLINSTNQLFGHWGFCELRRQRDGGGAKMSPQFLADVKYTLETLKNICHKTGFASSSLKIYSSLNHLANTGAGNMEDASSIGTEMRNVIEAVSWDTGSFVFLRVQPDRREYVDNDALLGDAVTRAFPSSVNDIREAGNCLAAECNTAAVFHLMRTAEWGLRALCVNLGFRRVKSKIRAKGSVTYTPIEYLEWETMLNQLQSKVDGRLQKLKKGREKQLLQEFYYPMLQDIRGLRDAWRNHIMHTRAEYNRKDADAVLEHVRRLMVILSKRVSEV